MKRSVFALAAGLIVCGAGPTSAADAPFGCDARAPRVCYFRIFFTPRGDRVVTLPGGTKERIPGVTIGRDHYCMTLGKTPDYKCARKLVNDQYNN